MNIWPFGKRKHEVRADTIVNPSEQVESDALLSALLGKNVMTKEKALEIPAVQACINLIAGTISLLPVNLYQKDKEGNVREVRDRIHDGHLLLTHPLSGSVKPNETPYKSVLISAGKEEVDRRSLTIIENAIDACHKFQDKTGRYGESVLEDFQLIDWTLLESGLASADAW